jgi:pimeloyl-ACP methyl ester carboxylesterase
MNRAGNKPMKVITNGLATEYEIIGEGKIILMLHGWGDSLHTFDKISKYLSKKYKIVRLDLPGFGLTEMQERAWEISDYVDFVSLFLNKIGIVPYSILGHSFGGRITIKGVATKIFNPKKIILIGSAGISKKNTLRNIIITIATKIFSIITFIPPISFYRKKIRAKIYKIIGSDYIDTGDMRETYLNIISEDLREYAGKIDIQTQLIWGNEDTETPLKDAKRFNSLIEKSRLNLLTNAGHLVHQEKSGEVSKIIEDFLE